MSTVKIDSNTAKYYLNLEHAFETICRELTIDPDSYLENFQSITTSFDVSKRYTYRCDLHDSWEKAVAKREYQPTKRRRASVEIPLPPRNNCKGSPPIF